MAASLTQGDHFPVTSKERLSLAGELATQEVKWTSLELAWIPT